MELREFRLNIPVVQMPSRGSNSGKNTKAHRQSSKLFFSALFSLTCEDDQDGAQQQINSRLPSRWHASHGRRNEDLCWDVELQRKGDEDAETVEQLDDLVRPKERGRQWKAKGEKSENIKCSSLSALKWGGGLKPFSLN